jgi:hypothetical protein
MKKLLMLFAVMIILTACESKSGKLSKNDDFSNSTTIKEDETPSRIKVIEGSSWKYFWIIEVDGHQYLANANNGGIVHLESCPCKTKSYGN